MLLKVHHVVLEKAFEDNLLCLNVQFIDAILENFLDSSFLSRKFFQTDFRLQVTEHYLDCHGLLVVIINLIGSIESTYGVANAYSDTELL